MAGAPDGGGHVKRPSACLKKKEKKAARQTEATVWATSTIIQPMKDTFCKTQTDSEDQREARVIQGQQARDANDAYNNEYLKMGRTIDSLVVGLSKAKHGDLVYNHLESHIKECKADRRALKAKFGRF